MFRHKGKSRKFRQNIGIASLLSFVAGVVNVVGVLAVQRLTSNVTGHFAFMVEEAAKMQMQQAVFYAIYVFFFFIGACFSRVLIELISMRSEQYAFIVPVLIEMLILTTVVFLDLRFIQNHPNEIACTLLFAMGLQNALVTTISNSVVRTTHLTGLFTDMGIEVAQLLFYRSATQQKKLTTSIKLRLAIIAAFFVGGVAAGFLFAYFQTRTLLLASATLLIGLVSDYVRIKFRQRKIRQQKLEGKKTT